MTKRQEAKIIQLDSQGFSPHTIASMLKLPSSEVGAVLTLVWQQQKSCEAIIDRETELANARALMLKAGYDPAVVDANFPEGELG